MEIYEKVQKFIDQESLLDPGATVIAGVSGGPDSMTLLDVLVKLGYRVIAAHLNHSLRPESQSEAEFVRTMSASYHCEFVMERLEKGELSGTDSSLEESARIHRYQFFLRTAEKYNALRIAVGHTSDDQVETILMHLLRGAGPSGLRGMLSMRHMHQWFTQVYDDSDEKIFLVRPLLELERKETILHCGSIGVEPKWDQSNLDKAFFRNRIRHELIPLMETYNSGFRRHLLQTATLMSEQVEFIDGEMEKQRDMISRQAGRRSTAFSRGEFQGLPAGLQRGLLVDTIKHKLPQERNLTFSILNSTRDCALKGEPGRIPIIGDLDLVHAGNEFLITDNSGDLKFPQYPITGGEIPIDLHSDGISEIDLGHQWRINARIIHDPDPDYFHTLPEGLTHSRVAFNLTALDGPLELRPRIPGDRLSLSEKGGRKKVSDLLMAGGIPLQVRNSWPLLASPFEVLWIPGIRRSSALHVESVSACILEMELVHSLGNLQFFPEDTNHGFHNRAHSRGQNGKDGLNPGSVFSLIALHRSTKRAAEELEVPHSLILKPMQKWQDETGLRILIDDAKGNSTYSGSLTALGLQILRSVLEFSYLYS